jgi:7-cyano-7-deazaguanine synthase
MTHATTTAGVEGQHPRAALLLSGGLDSTALATWYRPGLTITIDYGQLPAAAEIRAATQVARALGLRHAVVRLDARALGAGDLAGGGVTPGAPGPEWWPFRNQLLLTVAAMYVVSRESGLKITTLLVGTVRGDRTRFADGTPEFVEAIGACLALQEGALRVEAPALGMTTAELIRASGAPRSLLGWAHSCHVAEVACGRCRGCRKHQEVTGEVWGAEHAY